VGKSWDFFCFYLWNWFFVFGFGTFCLRVVLGFDDDGEREGKEKGFRVSGLGRVWNDVLCWFGMDRGFLVDAAVF
jgi:hypothetical protein